jgi:hypothetical protein
VRAPRILFLWSVLAVAALVAALCPMLARSHTGAGRSANVRGGAVAGRDRPGADDVAGLAGELEPAHLRVRLARLHSDPARQRFDALALGRHFGLGTGEPFLCELASSGVVVPGGALRAISVRDDRGVALAPFQPSAASPGEPADPLATLLSPPPDALSGGRAVSVILWGREPGSGARLSGLEAGEVALAPARMTVRELDTALARIDAPLPARTEGAK